MQEICTSGSVRGRGQRIPGGNIVVPPGNQAADRENKLQPIVSGETGLLDSIRDDLFVNPKYGASWEGYVIEEAIGSVEPDDVYFWATHNGAEIDLVFSKSNASARMRR
jgi:predicted AAA+ superfamily ATPase